MSLFFSSPLKMKKKPENELKKTLKISKAHPIGNTLCGVCTTMYLLLGST